MTSFKTIDDLGDIAEKRVLVRVDLNVPMADGKVTDFTRIERVAPGILELSEKAAKVILMAHFGRPKGKPNADMSLEPIAHALEAVLDARVYFSPECIGDVPAEKIGKMVGGNILMLENTRFHAGEENNDPEFARALASLGDIFVNDAFSAAHRAHASTEGLAHLLPCCAGRTMAAELTALQAGLGNPRRPVIAIVGGAKVSTKINLLQNLVERVDMLVIGGGMANTFLHAKGIHVGKSLCEKDLADTANKIMAKAEKSDCRIILPEDVVVAKKFEANADNDVTTLDAVPADGMILDAGPQSVDRILEAIDEADTLVWNGPLGAFEIAPFDHATVAVARHVAERTETDRLISVAGGGDTVAALNHAGVADEMTYLSTAGGAFLEWMEGKPLPGVVALSKP
ncbi:MAG: phosphoglycerate kinase [Rhizobiaceae bacterium]